MRGQIMNHVMVAIAAVGFSIILSGCQQTPKDYDECILENVKSGMGESAVLAIQQSCALKYYNKIGKDFNAESKIVKIYEPDWHMLRDGTKAPDGYSFYIDKNSIEIVGNDRTFWLKGISGSGGIKSKDFNLQNSSVDCAGKTYTNIKMQYWENNLRKNEDEINTTTTVTPDTVAVDIYNYVCYYQSS